MPVRSIFSHYWRFVRQYPKSHLAILGGYAAGQFGATVVIPLIYKRIIDIVSGEAVGTAHDAYMMVGALALTIAVYNVGYRLGDYFMIFAQSKIMESLANYCLSMLESHSHSFFANTFTGGLIAKSKRFVGAFETLHDLFVFTVWMNGLALLFAMLVLFYNSWILGAIFLVWFALYVCMTWYLVRLQIPKSTKNAAADSRTTGHFSDIVSNILTVKMFGTGKREIIEFEKTTHEQEQLRFTAWLQQGFWNSLFQAISIGAFNIVIIAASVWLWANGTITAGAIVLVQVYVVTIFNIVWTISKNIVRASSALTDAQEMVAIFEQEPDVQDAMRPKRIKVTQGEIVFRNVSFGYEDDGTIFENLSFTITPGERVAFVGHSGAGKTTVTKLLLRFADVSKGVILIDGNDIAKVRQDELRSSIAYVPQDPVLFHRSIRDNIAYGKPNATDEEVISAATRARAHEFIERLKRGYNTMVGERGVKLSGGERQRVAIARAMLKDAPILVLDEATSSLDSISERYIQEALAELMQGRTTIVIAHRLSTIQGMDRIIVFGKGGIAEEGTHDVLLAQGGVYAALWNSQRGGFVE
ncbi:MAG: hypothetical protein RLZZ234_680 [Candidatus Parcubacteria bacterium]